MSFAPIPIAAVGLGWVACNRHIPTLLRSHEYRLVGVIDRYAGRAVETAEKFKLMHYARTDNLAQVDWLSDVAAVLVATPPAVHAEMIKAALTLGKHVLTEKPFTMTVAEGESMALMAKEKQNILVVMHNFQFSRAFRKLEADLKNGKLGFLRRIAVVQHGNPCRCSPLWRDALPLGLFYDESAHFFYLLRRLGGGALTLHDARGVGEGGGKTPRLVSLLYRGAEQVPVTIDCQYDSSISEWYIMVTGEKAFGVYDIYRDIYMRLPNDGAHGMPQVLRTSCCAIGQHVGQHVPNGLAYLLGRMDYGTREVLCRFARAIRGENEALEGINTDEALAVLRLQHEALNAIRENWFT